MTQVWTLAHLCGNWAKWVTAAAGKSTVGVGFSSLADSVLTTHIVGTTRIMTWVLDTVLVQSLVVAGVALLLVVRTAR